MMPSRPAVFLDKDGTLVEDVPYNVDPARMRLAPGVADGLRTLAASGLPLFLVSNQPGVALGLFPESRLTDVDAWLAARFAECGATLAGTFYCPHHPQGTVDAYRCACDCRKPWPGLLLRASRECGVDLRESWIVGDILDDVEAGRRAGCRAILIDNGNETHWRVAPLRQPDHLVPDFAAAATLIVARQRRAAETRAERA